MNLKHSVKIGFSYMETFSVWETLSSGTWELHMYFNSLSTMLYQRHLDLFCGFFCFGLVFGSVFCLFVFSLQVRGKKSQITDINYSIIQKQMHCRNQDAHSFINGTVILIVFFKHLFSNILFLSWLLKNDHKL